MDTWYGERSDFDYTNGFELTKKQDILLNNVIDNISMLEKNKGWTLKEARDKIFSDEAFSNNERNMLWRILKGHFLVTEEEREVIQYIKDRHKEMYGV